MREKFPGQPKQQCNAADAQDVHFGQCQFQGTLETGSTLEQLRMEAAPLSIDFPYLRDSDGDLSQAGVEGIVFAAVGMARALLGTLVRGGSEVLLPLDLHDGVEET